MTRAALDDLWRERTLAAQRRHKLAKIQCARALDEQHHLAAPDGSLAYRLALRAETEALAEYRRVLGIFMDLVIKDVPPPEETEARAC